MNSNPQNMSTFRTDPFTICVDGTVADPVVNGTSIADGGVSTPYYYHCVENQWLNYYDPPWPGDPCPYEKEVFWLDPDGFDSSPSSYSFESCGTYSFDAWVKGTPSCASCSDTDEVFVGTFTVTVIKAEVKSVTFTTSHDVLTDYNSDFEGSGGTTYSPTGWQKSPAINNPVTHTKGTSVGVNVTINVCPSGVQYDLTGTGTELGVSFHANALVGSGSDQAVTITADVPLASQIDILSPLIVWTVTANSKTCDAGDSGSHDIYVTWDTPFNGEISLIRVDWACGITSGLGNIRSIEEALQQELAGYFYLLDNCAVNAWIVLDLPNGLGYDCISLATCQKRASQVLGIPATVNKVYASTDTTCTTKETRVCSTHGSESLLVWGAVGGGQSGYAWNQWEACCVVDGVWYPGGFEESFDSDIEVLRDWLSATGVMQAWVYQDTTGFHYCASPGPYPVPSP